MPYDSKNSDHDFWRSGSERYMDMRNLFQSSSLANIAHAHPLSFFDIGARGEFDAGLWPLAFATTATGFEPDPSAYDKLISTPDHTWKSAQIFPIAISGQPGIRTLNVPSDPRGASLLEPMALSGAARTKEQFYKIIETHQVKTETLDHVIARFDLSAPEYLKIDIEGAELEVLKSSPNTLNKLLAIKVEVAFDKFRADQPLAHEIMEFLHTAGFVLMDLIAPAHWRTDGHVIHPLLDKTAIPYTRGQLAHGDFLYFRRPLDSNSSKDDVAQRNLKLALIAMSFGYFDFAADIFATSEIQAESRNLDCENPLAEIAVCSRKFGRIQSKSAFRDRLRGLGPFLRRFPDLLFR